MDYNQAERLRFYLVEQGFQLTGALAMAIACGADEEQVAMISHTLLEERRYGIAERSMVLSNGGQVQLNAGTELNLDDEQLFELAIASLDEIQSQVKNEELKESLVSAMNWLQGDDITDA